MYRLPLIEMYLDGRRYEVEGFLYEDGDTREWHAQVFVRSRETAARISSELLGKDPDWIALIGNGRYKYLGRGRVAEVDVDERKVTIRGSGVLI